MIIPEGLALLATCGIVCGVLFVPVLFADDLWDKRAASIVACSSKNKVASFSYVKSSTSVLSEASDS